MKIAIISDIHGNYEALRSFPETYDELWVLGDLVNFGPQPGEVTNGCVLTRIALFAATTITQSDTARIHGAFPPTKPWQRK